MDRNNERSFVARVYSDGKKMEFLQTSRNANILTTREGSGPPHAYDPISKKWVRVGRGPLKSTLLVHLRCYDSHYQLQILGKNDTYLSADYDDILGAFSSTQRDVTHFTLLNAEATTGVSLTESRAMHPGSAVSGLYFSHPESHYFMISDLQKDQIEDYAHRKGMRVEEMEKWLGPWLGY